MKVKDTYNMIKPPIMDTSRQVIVFAFSQFCVPDEQKRNALFKSLTQAVESKDYNKMYEILTELDDYRLSRVEVKPQLKQSEIVEVQKTTKKRKRVKKDE